MDYNTPTLRRSNTPRLMRLIVTGGGTGGHILPALAFYEEFISKCSEENILYIGRKNSIEEKLVKENGFNFKYIPSASYNKGIWNFIVANSVGIVKSMALIINGKYDVVLGFGGYTAFPALFAGLLLKKQVIVHESNAVPGKVVRFLARMGASVAYGFESCKENLKGVKRICFTGTPVRKKFFNSTKEDGWKVSGLKTGLPVVMVVGGSQGSGFLNNIAVGLVKKIKEFGKNVQVVHISGIENENDFNKEYSENNIPAYSVPFSNDIGPLYKIADVVISRAGALTVTELSITNTPAVLVPLPSAADNHQLKNAEVLKQKNMAVVIQEENFDINDVAECVVKLLETNINPTNEKIFFQNAAASLLNFVESRAKSL